MRQKQLFSLVVLTAASLLFQGCNRNSDEVWEDAKSAGRHVQRGFKTMMGRGCDSPHGYSKGDFEPSGNEYYWDRDSYEGSQSEEFIPLDDTDEIGMADVYSKPSRETPGEPGSRIPGIEAFKDPSLDPSTASIFKSVYFDYDSSTIKGDQNMRAIHAIANYLQRNPNVYVFIEGHADEKGPQAYNLALGSRRANSARALLISDGVHPDRLFTTSYGKERPAEVGSTPEAWAKNRRDEFKIYEGR